MFFISQNKHKNSIQFQNKVIFLLNILFFNILNFSLKYFISKKERLLDFPLKSSMKNSPVRKRQPLLADDQSSVITEHQHDPHIFNNYYEYFLSMVGYAVGFGSFWRFPYLIYKNGGGVFFIPYFLALFIVGIPLFYLQTAVGQMHRTSLPFIFQKINKGLKWLGMTFIFCGFHMAGYYNIILTYSYRLIFSGFNFELPFINQSAKHENYYFEHQVLHKSKSINQFGAIQPGLFTLFVFSVLVCYYIVKNGVKTSGKIIVFTSLAPYLFLLILLIRGMFLEGANEGLAYLFQPKWHKLFTAQIWVDAIIQVFYQVSVAISGIVNLSSMKPRRQKFMFGIYAIPASLIICGMLCALNVFMYLGHFSNQVGIKIDQLTLSGPQLSFNVFPKALSILPFPNLWIIFFFITMVMLGIDTQFAFLETIYCYLKDEIKNGQIRILGFSFDLEQSKKLVIFGVILFAPTLTSQAGIYYLQFYDSFVSTIPFTLGAIIQLYIFVHLFKFQLLQAQIERYTKQQCPRWIKYLLQSRLLMIILIGNFIIGFIRQFFQFFNYSIGFYIFGWVITTYPYIIAFISYQRNKQQKFRLTFQQINERHSHL